jgi:hypothetical protein
MHAVGRAWRAGGRAAGRPGGWAAGAVWCAPRRVVSCVVRDAACIDSRPACTAHTRGRARGRTGLFGARLDVPPCIFYRELPPPRSRAEGGVVSGTSQAPRIALGGARRHAALWWRTLAGVKHGTPKFQISLLVVFSPSSCPPCRPGATAIPHSSAATASRRRRQERLGDQGSRRERFIWIPRGVQLHTATLSLSRAARKGNRKLAIRRGVSL